MPHPCPVPPASLPRRPQNSLPWAFKTSVPSSSPGQRLTVSHAAEFQWPAGPGGRGRERWVRAGQLRVWEGPRWRVRWGPKPHRPVLGSVSPSMHITDHPASNYPLTAPPTAPGPKPRLMSTTQQAALGQDIGHSLGSARPPAPRRWPSGSEIQPGPLPWAQGEGATLWGPPLARSWLAKPLTQTTTYPLVSILCPAPSHCSFPSRRGCSLGPQP